MDHNDESRDGSIPSADDTCESHSNGILAKQESRVVGRFKLAVLAVLIAATIIVATTIYVHLSSTEETNFSTAFNDDSAKILETIGTRLDKSFGLLDSVAVLYISIARVTNQTWPFVTMPDFAIRMAKILPLTDAIAVNVLPIVTAENRKKWEAYSIQHDSWVNESMAVQETWSGFHGPKEYQGAKKHGVIHSDYGDLPYNISRDFIPNWQNFPVIPNTPWTYNTDWATVSFAEAYLTAASNHKATVSEPYMVPTPGDELEAFETELWSQYYSDYIPKDQESKEPMSDIAYPIIDDISRVETTGDPDYNPANHSIVGLIVASMYWRDVIRGILPYGSNGIQIVFVNPCSTSSYTYQISGPTAQYLGVGDHHDPKYDDWRKEVRLDELDAFAIRQSTYSGAPLDDSDYCPFTLNLYPSDLLASHYISRRPVIFTVAVIFIFLFTSLVFVLYDVVVEKRQRLVLHTAVQSSAIVSSLFPAAVRDRLYPHKHDSVSCASKGGKDVDHKHRFSDLQRDSRNTTLANNDCVALAGPPIATSYPDTTVLFADISGFTAWSAMRQPTQVFTLLETLYAGFDELAKQHGVFKVETVGDCYVAVVGLPTSRKSHAVVIARFASHCRQKMRQLTTELAKTLGPDTANLALRIGLNSGPTTAGVLRGEKARFQLFGDTVNTAARMETNGEVNRIHVSQSTAEQIRLAGKEHWLTPRQEPVECKGKGLMRTYWVEPKAESVYSSEAGHMVTDQLVDPASPNAMLERLIQWNVDLFTGLLHNVIQSHSVRELDDVDQYTNVAVPAGSMPVPGTLLADVIKVLPLLPRSVIPSRKTVEIAPAVSSQLRDFIVAVAHLYPLNSFHNFEHCSHVSMSAKRFLDRMTASSQTDAACALLCDPLTQFAICFAALIHDVDHPGVSNAQLVVERHRLALLYDNESVAEQNSLNMAWNLIMGPKYTDLCASLFAGPGDQERFRQIVVNVVMATSLFDTNLQALRDTRWNESFHSPANADEDASQRRATILIDLIIQASDVSHTMQHFSLYKKWNRCLLQETYAAYQSGRTGHDPTVEWYNGELAFFDKYVIPLAQKMEACQVFGASSDECVRYARDNRAEWEIKGRDIVSEAMESFLLAE